MSEGSEKKVRWQTHWESTMAKLYGVLTAMDDKLVGIILDWIRRWADYLKSEKTFDSKYLKAYYRGEIILVDFGVGRKSEEGGTHYAVVMDNSNNPRNPLLMVIPFTSLDNGKTCHKNDVELPAGLIKDISPRTGENVAKGCGSAILISQLGRVSKQAVIRPQKTSDPVLGKVPAEIMKEVERRVAERYLKSVFAIVSAAEKTAEKSDCKDGG